MRSILINIEHDSGDNDNEKNKDYKDKIGHNIYNIDDNDHDNVL